MKETSKNILRAIVLLLLLVLGYGYFSGGDINLGGVGSDPSYTGVTNSSVVCSGATSTLVSAAQPGRTSFVVSLGVSTTPGANVVYLCKSASCSKYTGLVLTTTTPAYTQEDSYVGAYSCITLTDASTTLITAISN